MTAITSISCRSNIRLHFGKAHIQDVCRRLAAGFVSVIGFDGSPQSAAIVDRVNDGVKLLHVGSSSQNERVILYRF